MSYRAFRLAIFFILGFTKLSAADSAPVENEDFCESLTQDLIDTAKRFHELPKKSLETYDEFSRIVPNKKVFDIVCSADKKFTRKIESNAFLKDLPQSYEKPYRELYKKTDFSIAPAVQADQCSDATVDTSDMPENRDQGNLVWCHAYVTADLLSFFTKRKLSAYDIAVQSLVHGRIKLSGPISQMGNSVTADLEYALNSTKGICLESELKLSGNNWSKLSRMIERLSDPKSGSLDAQLCTFEYQDAFKHLTPILSALVDKLNPNSRLAALLDLQCGARVQIPKAGASKENNIQGEDGRMLKGHASLDAALSAGRPVGVAYQDNFLFKGTYKTDFHGSTVIGRRLYRGRCQYLLRNSWGKNCKDVDYSSRIECVDGTGNLWVDRNELLQNLLEVYDVGKYFPKTSGALNRKSGSQ